MAPSFIHVVRVLAVLMQAGRALTQTPDGFSPQTNNTLSIYYSGSAATSGTQISVTAVGASPSVQLAQTNASDIIMMLDLDAPGGRANNSLSPILHWLESIPAGITMLAENQTSIHAIAPYIQPNPPAGSGPHRYVILQLENPNPKFKVPAGFAESYETIESRLKFDVAGFIKAGDFQLLSATWFTVAPANYTVPESDASLMVPNYASIAIGSVSIVVALIAAM